MEIHRSITPLDTLESTRFSVMRTTTGAIYNCFENRAHFTDLIGLRYLCDIVYHVHKDLALWKNQKWASENYSPSDLIATEESMYIEEIVEHFSVFNLLNINQNDALEQYGLEELLLCLRVYHEYLFKVIPKIIPLSDYENRMDVNEHYNMDLLEDYCANFTKLFDDVCESLERVERMRSDSLHDDEEMYPWEVVYKTIEGFPAILIDLDVVPPPIMRPRSTPIPEKIKTLTAREFLAQSPDSICPICYDELEGIETFTMLPFCQHVFCSTCLHNAVERSWNCPVCRRDTPLFLDVTLEDNQIIPGNLLIRNNPDPYPMGIPADILIFK